jgi:hypothetical protein
MWIRLSRDVDKIVQGCGCFCNQTQTYKVSRFEFDFKDFFFDYTTATDLIT